jgi:hypothetical protein
MRAIVRLCFALLLGTSSFVASAQTDAQTAPVATRANQHFYQLVFRVQEVDADGKITNTRTYSAITGNYDRDAQMRTIRTGTRVPIRTTDKGDWQYLDVGVNIDFQNPIEVGDELMIPISAQISSLVPTPRDAASGDPAIRQNTWRAEAKIALGKPTVIFSSDNLDDKGKLQLELTATRMK